MTWASCLIMGLAHLVYGQIGKGLLYLAVQLLAVGYFLGAGGFSRIAMLPGLGSAVRQEIYDEAAGIYVYTPGDRSQLILLYGIVSILLLGLFFLIWSASVRGGYRVGTEKRTGGSVPNLGQELRALGDRNLHRSLMFFPAAFLLIFTITPLIYMMSMAFTDFSRTGDRLVLFDWVGLRNFRTILSPESGLGRQLRQVLSWTLIWAFFATFLNFFLGLFLAMLISRPQTRWKGLWRGLLSVTVAVPQFVALLTVRSMFQPRGIVNQLLESAGGSAQPFLQNATYARVLVILVNLWVGIPFTVLQVTGILRNIPGDLYEAARLDGASGRRLFWHITLPYMLFVMTPYLITQFTANINNFNVIYLFTRGEPMAVGDTAGKTDLLVTWLYKLSVDQQKYNLAAVIGIITFLILSAVSLITYRNTTSYKNEEGFRG